MIFIFPFVLGLIPAAIAAAKGRNFFLWWTYGALLFIFALPHSLLMSVDRTARAQAKLDSEPNMKCPRCAELVKADAKVCRYCQHEFNLPYLERSCD